MENKQFELMKKYAKLGKRKRIIIEFLYECDKKYLKTSYVDLSHKTGLEVSNARNEIKELEKMGIVNIYRKFDSESLGLKKNGYKSNNPMVACELNLNWEDKILSL